MNEEVRRWWKQAKDDLEKAKILFNNKKYDGAIFFCQQAFEKALKALSIKCQNFPPVYNWWSDITSLKMWENSEHAQKPPISKETMSTHSTGLLTGGF